MFFLIGLIFAFIYSFGNVPASRLQKMLGNAGYISFEQVLRIIFGVLSGPLALCMLMLFRSFSTPSMLMGMFSMLCYFGCNIVGR